ncbi:MAG: exonuclease SbcCD subunit D C-terminal domain-containing protein [Bifidobacteriaceae bacterium]|jgi:exonuclease SbcD|nr:exonuclease SbcCD subunit D C-terminal domain-containing protein [Bifidobacteriaceae bacterium]
MRLIHTSDWHLGRFLHGVDLLEHQAAYLDHLVDLVRDERPAAVLVCGDVYDRAVPPVGAVQLLEESLIRLAEATQVIVISGNHDSATRLGFGSKLMRPEIKLFTRLSQVGQAVTVPDPDGGPGALVYPVPFLDVYAAAEGFSSQENSVARSHEAVFAAAAKRIRADLARRGLAAPPAPAGHAQLGSDRPAVVAMAHALVVGGEPSESERDLTVGGIATVPAGVFELIDYVALGHLHGPQRIAAAESQLIRYSGSPLAFSFSEARQVKSTAMVRLEPGGPRTELIPAPVPRPMAQVEGTLAELESRRFDPVAQNWLMVTVTDQSRPDNMTGRIARRFPHALVTRHLRAGPAGTAATGRVTAASDPLQVVADFLEYAGGTPATDAEQQEIRKALEAVGRARGEL